MNKTGKSLRPDLSVIITGRNDNHNGDFNIRAEYALRHNAALLAGAGVSCEFIWVEWNPLTERSLFASSVGSWVGKCVSFIVPNAVHNHFCDNPAIGVLQFMAKNVGMRRAAAEWVLSTNADTYLTADVVERIAGGNLDPGIMYLAERVDFHSRHLAEAPESYPIAGLEDREIARVSQVRLPTGFGSAGDFTLMHRDAVFEASGHFEGIRFSNSHLDTLFCLQHAARGGRFNVIGRVFHADHADSWNNFKTGSGKGHHHGFNYNPRRIRIPYANPGCWGLADFPVRTDDKGYGVLTPPPGLEIRSVAPAEAIIPPELDLRPAADLFAAALRTAEQNRLKVVVAGPGDQTREQIAASARRGMRLVGYIDEGRAHSELNCPAIGWSELAKTDFDVVLIGSLFWKEELYDKALHNVPPARILPAVKT